MKVLICAIIPRGGNYSFLFFLLSFAKIQAEINLRGIINLRFALDLLSIQNPIQLTK